MSNAQITTDLGAKIKDLEEENELLLLQLHQVQEELEVYFLKNMEFAVTSPNAGLGFNQGWVDDEFSEALAEVERLKTLATVQAEIKAIEEKNALNVRLGNMLLQASSSVGGIGKLPFSLLSFWRNATKSNPPSKLGGKEFTTVIKAYEDLGFVGVKSLLKGDAISPMVKGNAYTALARHLMQVDAKAAAEAATNAFVIDPKPYRLKWLACRLHEAGDAIRAEALIDLLPEDLTFSDSEKKQVSQIRYEAKSNRQREARKKTQVVSKQQQIQQQISDLKKNVEALGNENAALITARDEKAKLVAERQSEVNTLNEQKNQLAQARDAAVKQGEELKGQIEKLNKEKATLIQNHSALVKEKKDATEENELLLVQLHQVQEELEKIYLDKSLIEKEHKKSIVEISNQKDALAKEFDIFKLQHESIVEKLKNNVEAVRAEKFLRSLLEQEQVKNVGLAIARDEQTKLAVERQNQINALNEQKNQLAQARDVAVKQGEELKGQIEALSKEKAALTQEMTTLAQDKAALITARDEQTKLAVERQNQINALNEQKNQLAQARDVAVKQLDVLKHKNNECHEEIEYLSKEISDLSKELEKAEAINGEMLEKFKYSENITRELEGVKAQFQLLKELLKGGTY